MSRTRFAFHFLVPSVGSLSSVFSPFAYFVVVVRLLLRRYITVHHGGVLDPHE
jgi:hypothetical protein